VAIRVSFLFSRVAYIRIRIFIGKVGDLRGYSINITTAKVNVINHLMNGENTLTNIHNGFKRERQLSFCDLGGGVVKL